MGSRLAIAIILGLAAFFATVIMPLIARLMERAEAVGSLIDKL